MEERNKQSIDEAYFKGISHAQKLPTLQILRETQSRYKDHLFEIFINHCQTFSWLDKNSVNRFSAQARNVFLFKILEMSDLIDRMKLVEHCEPDKQCQKILIAIRQYRHVIADGYHALDDETKKKVIKTFCYFFSDLSNPNPHQSFKKSCKTFNNISRTFKKKFDLVNGGEQVYHYIAKENPKQENHKIHKLLNAVKDLLKLAQREFNAGHFDSAALNFIAAGNCARDFENYMCEKVKLEKDLTECRPSDCIQFYAPADKRDPHEMYDLLNQLGKIRYDRGRQFAHVCGKYKDDIPVALRNRLSELPHAVGYLGAVFDAIDTYISLTSDAETQLAAANRKPTDESPHGYTPKKVHARKDSLAKRSLFVVKRHRSEDPEKEPPARLDTETFLKRRR